MNFNDDFFTMLGLFITCVVQFLFYLTVFIVLLILAHRAVSKKACPSRHENSIRASGLRHLSAAV